MSVSMFYMTLNDAVSEALTEQNSRGNSVGEL